MEKHKIRVLYIWDADYPWDIRVAKTCRTLTDNDIEVHLVCRNKLRKPVEEHYDGISLHRVPFLSKRLGRINDLFTFPFFASPIWLRQINRVVKQYRIDLIIVRDLPMALSAIFVGRLRKISVILDMAECYPELIKLLWQFEPFKIQNIFIRNPLSVNMVERVVLRRVAHVFVMVEESMQRLINKGIPEDKITIVSNTPVLKRFKEAEVSFPGTLSQNRGKLILLYVGLINFSRGLDTVLESLSQFTEMNNKFYLLIIGTGNAEGSLRNLVNRLNLEKHVGFEGWVDNETVPKYVASSDICLVPHHKCSHWDNTIPNKLFDYMAAGKPVLVSDVKPVQRIVQEEECGLIYKDWNKESFVSQLLRLQDERLRKRLGMNGVQAVTNHYNWDKDSADMLKSLKKLVKI